MPDNSHSSTMHFSWHLQPCAITKKALTFLEWHLGPEWDVLYQHHAVQMGTNIHSSFMEMLRKQSGRQGVEMSNSRTQAFCNFFSIYTYSTWRALWDFRLALSAETKACVCHIFFTLGSRRCLKQAVCRQLWHIITLSSYSWSVSKQAWRNNLWFSNHPTNLKSDFCSNFCSLTTHERNVFTLLKPY